MSTWNQLGAQFAAVANADKGAWLQKQLVLSLEALSGQRSGRNVLLYGSAFLQKPQAPSNFNSINFEDLNGLMAVLHGMDWSAGLTVVLHSPGGQTNATESVVAYLRSKFQDIEVIVPTYAMSAGTMISLASDRIIMGRHSQLGPIDPQMPLGGASVSARAVIEQFDRAKSEIQADLKNAHLWAPVLQNLGPSLLQDAQNALDYSEQIVSDWLTRWMCSGATNPGVTGSEIAHHFNDATTHKSHARRIGRDEARGVGVIVEDLEGPGKQALQEAVLTAYHLMTIIFENTMATKIIASNHGQNWLKNFQTAEEAAAATLAQRNDPNPPQPPKLASPASTPSPQTSPNRAQRRRDARESSKKA